MNFNSSFLILSLSLFGVNGHTTENLSNRQMGFVEKKFMLMTFKKKMPGGGYGIAAKAGADLVYGLVPNGEGLETTFCRLKIGGKSLTCHVINRGISADGPIIKLSNQSTKLLVGAVMGEDYLDTTGEIPNLVINRNVNDAPEKAAIGFGVWTAIVGSAFAAPPSLFVTVPTFVLMELGLNERATMGSYDYKLPKSKYNKNNNVGSFDPQYQSLYVSDREQNLIISSDFFDYKNR